MRPLTRLSQGIFTIALCGIGLVAFTSPRVAWPHRAVVSGLGERSVAFRAYTLGGDFIIAVDSSGRLTTTPGPKPEIRYLTERDTITVGTPAYFPLDLTKGAVVFIAEGRDSLRLSVGRNPNMLDSVSATGIRFTVRLEGRTFVIDAR